MPTEDDAGSLSALTRAMNRLADALERLVPPDAAPRFPVGAGKIVTPPDENVTIGVGGTGGRPRPGRVRQGSPRSERAGDQRAASRPLCS